MTTSATSTPDMTIYDNPKKVSSFVWKYFGFRKDEKGTFLTYLILFWKYSFGREVDFMSKSNNILILNILKKFGK